METKAITVHTIENSGPNNLRDILRASLASASRANIAVAFVTQAGINKIIPSLQQVAAKGAVRIVVGLYQWFTEPVALRSLLRIQKQSRGRFTVRLSTGEHFHRKFYLLEQKSKVVAIIGSSNLTKEGLETGGELNVMLSVSRSGRVATRLNQVFEKDWARAKSLVKGQVEKYEHERKKRAKPTHSSPTRSTLAKILNTEQSHEKADPDFDQNRRFWRDCVSYAVGKKHRCCSRKRPAGTASDTGGFV